MLFSLQMRENTIQEETPRSLDYRRYKSDRQPASKASKKSCPQAEQAASDTHTGAFALARKLKERGMKWPHVVEAPVIFKDAMEEQANGAWRWV